LISRRLDLPRRMSRDLGTRGRGWQLGRDRPGRRLGRRPPTTACASGSRRRESSPRPAARWRASHRATRCSPTHLPLRHQGRLGGVAGRSRRTRRAKTRRRPVGDRSSVRGARARRRPGAHSSRTRIGRRVVSRTRRRRRDRRTRRSTRGRARSNRNRDSRPFKCGASAARARPSYSTTTMPTGRPACELHHSAGVESGPP
jgi:hypothetical protein